MISDVYPPDLREPENMSAAIIAKVHAENQLELIRHEINVLQTKKKLWMKRLTVCLKVISREATNE